MPVSLLLTKKFSPFYTIQHITQWSMNLLTPSCQNSIQSLDLPIVTGRKMGEFHLTLSHLLLWNQNEWSLYIHLWPFSTIACWLKIWHCFLQVCNLYVLFHPITISSSMVIPCPKLENTLELNLPNPASLIERIILILISLLRQSQLHYQYCLEKSVGQIQIISSLLDYPS